MNMMIPAELFNAIGVPSEGQSTVRITDYLKSMAYKLPNCSDLTIEREIWNTVCDISSRIGALREKQTGTLGAGGTLQISAPSYGDFHRLVGAGIGGTRSAITTISISDTATYPVVTFSGGTQGSTAYVEFSVIPDINANHDKTKSGSTYPNDKWVAPEWFLNKYSRIITAGAMFRVLGMTGRPWTDFNGARANAVVYNREINRLSHGLITSGMRKSILIGEEAPFVGNAQTVQSQPQSAQ